MLISGELHTDDATVLLCLFLPHSWWITDAFFEFMACSFPPTVFWHFIFTRNFYMGLFAGRLVEGDLCRISVAANAQIRSLLNDYHCNHSLLLSLCAASQMHRNSQFRPGRMMIHPFQAPCSCTTGTQFLMAATKIVSLKPSNSAKQVDGSSISLIVNNGLFCQIKWKPAAVLRAVR